MLASFKHFPLLRAAFLLAVAGMGFGVSLFAQPRSLAPSETRGVSLSEISTFGNRESVLYNIMPFGDDFFLATSESDRGTRNSLIPLKALRLYRYDANLQRSEALEIGWPDERREHMDITTVGERFVWTYGKTMRKGDKVRVAIDVLDEKGKKLSSAKLIDLDDGDFRRGRYETFDAYTPDRQHYVSVLAEESRNRLLSKRDDERASATVLVVSANGDIVSNRRINLKASRDQVNIQAVSVDNDGRAYVLAKVYENARGKERKRGGSDAKLYVYTLEPGAETAEQTEIQLQGQYIRGVSLIPNDEGAPGIIGLYSEKIRGLGSTEIAGYFSGTDVGDGTTLRPQPFTQATLAGMGKKVTSGREGNFSIEDNFVFRDALLKTNGRLSLLMESLHIRTTTDQNGNTTTYYVFGEGVIFDFDEAGELLGATMVPKAQSAHSPNAFYARMNLVEYEGRAAVLYNDNPKNLTREVTRRTKPLSWKNATAVLGFGNEKDELERLPLFIKRDADKLVAVPASVTGLSDDRIVFLALRYKMFGKNEVRFGIIEH